MISHPPTHILDMKIKGLSTDPVLFRDQVNQTRQHLQLFKWKQRHTRLPNIVVLLGGTGTGKSTLFNALIENNISAESVKRPTTGGGIAYVHSDDIALFSEGFPFATEILSSDHKPLSGHSQKLTLISHENSSLLSPIFVDSPDVDSLCLENKYHAQKLFLLADLILFVTSCEKYADQEPLEILKQAKKEGKQLLIVLNKNDDDLLSKSIYDQLITISGTPDVHFFTIPRRKKPNEPDYMESIFHLRKHLLEISNNPKNILRKQEILSLSHSFKKSVTDIQIKLDNEIAVYKKIEQLLFDAAQTSKEMLLESPAIFNRSYFDSCIKPHIKDVYSRHDLLAPVRQWVVETLKKPFYLFSKTENKQPKTLPLPPEMDLTPVLTALGEYQYYVKKHVNTALFLKYLQEQPPELDAKTVNQLFQEKMIAINRWLTEQFEKLNKGIPVQKRFGIHALSLIWGAAIIGLETISGGLSPIELALDSILAPYLTAGATELFVVNELKNIVHHLRNQYIKALHSIIEHQHQEYTKILEVLKPESIQPRNGLVLM
ncbi:ABC transporter [Candidatus Magnetomorum sp. HK-1]|nr:ABC transporter [Candidatus Magnetomorum sp. HK-1]